MYVIILGFDLFSTVIRARVTEDSVVANVPSVSILSQDIVPAAITPRHS
jgi:hypothetical protein